MVHEARGWLVDQLAAFVPPLTPAARDDCELGLSEILTNAIVHGSGRFIRIRCTIEDNTVRIEVLGRHKGSGPRPAQDLPDSISESGRGLFIVRYIAKDMGWDQHPRDWLLVWFTIPADRQYTDVDAREPMPLPQRTQGVEYFKPKGYQQPVLRLRPDALATDQLRQLLMDALWAETHRDN